MDSYDFQHDLGLELPIYTERLMLRPFMPGDGKIVFEAVEESRETFKQWMTWVDLTQRWEDSEAEAKEFYESVKKKEALPLIAFNKDGRMVGCGGYITLNFHVPSGEIGYFVRESEQGKGYAKEMAAAMTLYGFRALNLKRVVILCHKDNHKSRAIPEQLGYELELVAKGIATRPGANGLEFGHQYVRFSDDGLERFKVKW